MITAIEDLREAEHSYDFVKAGSVTNDASSVHIGTLHYIVIPEITHLRARA